MAQAGFTPIKLYYSTVTGNAPTAVNLSDGELAINIADGKLFYKDSGGTVSVLAQAGAVVANSIAGGLANQIVYQTAPNTTSFVAAPSTPGTFLYWNGSAFSWLTGAGLGSVTSVDASGGTTGLTFTGGPITNAGTLTMSGTLAVSHGGTGITSFGTGVATALGYNTTGSGGIVLEDSPVLVTPDLGIPSAVDLTNATNVPAAQLSGTVSVANGGTGAATLTANNLITGNGTSAVGGIAPGPAGYVLSSNGSTWLAVSPEAAGGSPIGTMVYMAGTTTTGYPGSTWLKCDGSVLPQSTYSTLFNRIGLAPDGFSRQIQWGYMAQSATNILRRLIYGGGQWVVVGDAGKVTRSPDGFNWDFATTVTTSNFNDVAYLASAGQYVTGGQSGVLYTSTNATTWSAGTSNTTSILYNVYATTSLVAISGDGGVYRASTDAVVFSTYGPDIDYAAVPSMPVAKNGNVYVAAGAAGKISYANAALSFSLWTAATSGTSSIIKAAHSNGTNLFMVGGDGGVLLTSLNGITWTARTSATASNINCFTNNGTTLYVYGTTGGGIGTSPDGTTWTARTSGTTSEIRDVHWDGTQYVYVGVGGVIATSPNAITWTARTSGTTSTLEAVWGNGTRWVAAGYDNTVLTSTDAITWTTVTTPLLSREDISSVAYGAGVWVAATQGGQTVTSTDGISWSFGRNFGVEWLLVNYTGGVFIFSTSNFVATTTDLVSYTYSGGSAQSRRIYDMATNDDGTKWVMVGERNQNNNTNANRWSSIRYSSDGYTYLGAPILGTGGGYNKLTEYTITTLQSVAYGNGIFVAGGNNGAILTSTDGENWTTIGLATRSTATLIEYGTDIVALGYEMQRMATQAVWYQWETSPNPSTANQGLFAPIRAINDGSQIVTCGGSGLVWTTTDAVTWTSNTTPTTQQLNCLGYNGSLYLIGGQSNTILTSTDAVTWTSRTSAVGTHMYGLAWGAGPGLWVLTTNSGGIQTSPDGITWTARTSGTAQSLNWAHYANNLYVVVGNNTTIVTSTNGTTWTLTTLAGGNWGYVTYAQSKWVISGTTTVQTTTDFVTYTPVYTTPQAALNVTAYYGDVTGRWYLVAQGGYTICTSTDLVTFSTNYGFPQNATVNTITYDGQYFIAGTSSGVTVTARNLYTSTDGQVWYATTTQQDTISACLAVQYGNNLRLAVGNSGRGLYASTDPTVSWYAHALLTTSQPRAIAYGSDGKVVVVGQGGIIRTSTDGRVFTPVTSGTTSVLNTVTYGNGLWIAAGDGGAWQTSTDGYSWTTSTRGATQILDVIYIQEQGIWLYTTAGAPGGVVTSSDLITFTGRATTIAAGNIYAAAWGGGQVAVVSDSGEMSISNNGINGYWSVTQIVSSPSVSPQSLVNIKYLEDSDQHKWIVGAGNGIICTSAGGWDWDMHRCMSIGTTTAQYGTMWGLTYHEGYYFAAGSFNSVFYTKDQDSWVSRVPVASTVTFFEIRDMESTPYGLIAVGLNNGIYELFPPSYNYDTTTEFRVPDADPRFLPAVTFDVESALYIKAL